MHLFIISVFSLFIAKVTISLLNVNILVTFYQSVIFLNSKFTVSFQL